MTMHNIMKKFETQEDCNKWEAENCPNMTYKGKKIIMIFHEAPCGQDTVLLKEIWTV